MFCLFHVFVPVRYHDIFILYFWFYFEMLTCARRQTFTHRKQYSKTICKEITELTLWTCDELFSIWRKCRDKINRLFRKHLTTQKWHIYQPLLYFIANQSNPQLCKKILITLLIFNNSKAEKMSHKQETLFPKLKHEDDNVVSNCNCKLALSFYGYMLNLVPEW